MIELISIQNLSLFPATVPAGFNLSATTGTQLSLSIACAAGVRICYGMPAGLGSALGIVTTALIVVLGVVAVLCCKLKSTTSKSTSIKLVTKYVVRSLVYMELLFLGDLHSHPMSFLKGKQRWWSMICHPSWSMRKSVMYHPRKPHPLRLPSLAHPRKPPQQ